jgi:small subunit ribosomal protein S18
MKKSKANQIYFEYKDPVQLSKYIIEGGKIVPARISKFNIATQKRLNEAIKRARNLALLPIGINAYDLNPRIEPVHPVPFSID